jgi:hypothetical protein
MKSRQTRELISAARPEHPNTDLHTGDPKAVVFSSMTDGTTTVVQITLHGEPIGTGVAKRRKGDSHNNDLGMALALTRAFTDAATRYARTVDEILSEEPYPQHVAIRNLVRGRKRVAALAKDARRKAARERFREIHGWDHTDRPPTISDWPVSDG